MLGVVSVFGQVLHLSLLVIVLEVNPTPLSDPRGEWFLYLDLFFLNTKIRSSPAYSRKKNLISMSSHHLHLQDVRWVSP